MAMERTLAGQSQTESPENIHTASTQAVEEPEERGLCQR